MIPRYEKNGGMAGIRLKNTEKLERARLTDRICRKPPFKRHGTMTEGDIKVDTVKLIAIYICCVK